MKKKASRKKYFMFNVLLAAVLFLFFLPAASAGAAGPPRISLDPTRPQKISLTVGKSIILRSTERVMRVSLGTPEGIPEIAVAMVLTPQQIYLTGKNPGVTNLTIWGGGNKVAYVFDVEVSPDVSRLKQMIRDILPEEKNVQVTATHDSITLSGSVSSKTNLDHVAKLAEPYFPKKVVNLLKVDVSPSEARDKEEKFRAKLAEILPEERDIRVHVINENLTLSGTVRDKAAQTQALTLAESYFPQKVTNLMKAEDSASRLKEAFYKILPDEKNIRVIAAQDNVTLSGTVSSNANLSQVLALAEAYYPKKVVNLLEVAGVHQVMLEVRVAEMSRSLQRRLGLNWNYISDGGHNLGISLLNSLTALPSQGWPSNPLSVSDKINAIFRFTGLNATWTTLIDAMKEEGLVKVLAEPTLITMNGRAANFLAGGEYPIPVPQSGVSNSITVEYKSFGVGLNFTPTVLSNRKISMQVAPEVSDLDFSNAISISGFVIPALTTRRVSTVIELADGQSFAIAGLLRDNVREVVHKFPLLGDIPILGALFRSTSFQKNETELIVIVTPHLVKPLDLAKQTLPTDEFIEPDDFEFYLLGRLEGTEKKSPGAAPSSKRSGKGLKMEGEFGHAVPK